MEKGLFLYTKAGNYFLIFFHSSLGSFFVVEPLRGLGGKGWTTKEEELFFKLFFSNR